jgi:hypothetical protein
VTATIANDLTAATALVGAVNTLSQLAGEIGTGAAHATSQSMGQFLDPMLDPFADGRSATGWVGGPALSFAPERPANA